MCSEIIAASWCQNNNLEITECTYGPLKLFWNKHFPEVIKRCSVAKSIRTMNFIDLKYTVQYLLTLPKVRVLGSEQLPRKSVQLENREREIYFDTCKIRNDHFLKQLRLTFRNNRSMALKIQKHNTMKGHSLLISKCSIHTAKKHNAIKRAIQNPKDQQNEQRFA